MVLLLVSLSAPGTASAGAEPQEGAPVGRMTLGEARAFLAQRAVETVRACRILAEDGTPAYMPDGEGHYRAFWVRDFCYMVEGAPEAVPAEEIERGYLWLIARQRADGAMPDRVELDGEPTYMPGPRNSPIGREPVSDGPQFMVKLACVVVAQTGRVDAFLSTADALERGLRYLPRSPQTNLVHIAPEESRAPYGFTDTVRKKGDLLFSSLLYMEAADRLASLFKRAGKPERAISWTAEAKLVRRGLESLWDESSGYYQAASARCRQPDVWGTAYAVHLGAVDEQRRRRIARQMLEDAELFVRAGQIRHLPVPMFWEDCLAAQGTYQNGGYWSTATGWVYTVFRHADPLAAERLIIDLAEDFRRRGTVPEWTTAQTAALTQYGASLGAPLAALRGDAPIDPAP